MRKGSASFACALCFACLYKQSLHSNILIYRLARRSIHKDWINYVLTLLECYLPIQKLEKIFPSKSSEVNCPVISARLICACLKSSATSSPA